MHPLCIDPYINLQILTIVALFLLLVVRKVAKWKKKLNTLSVNVKYTFHHHLLQLLNLKGLCHGF